MTSSQRRSAVIAACLGWLFSAVDIVLLILFQQPVADALGVEAQSVRIAIGVGLLGSALGGVAFAQLGDRYGRVRALGWAVLVYSLATAGMAASPNIAVLMAFRFVAGIGTGGEWSLGFALIAEVWPSAGRGKVGGLVTAMFNVGTFLAIGLYQLGLSWRVAFAVMIAPAAWVLWLRSRVPESPVWLALQEARRAGGAGEASLSADLAVAPVRALFRPAWRSVTVRTTLLFAVLNFAFYGFSTVFINYLQHAPDGTASGGLGLDRAGEMPYQLALNFAAMFGVITAGALSDRLGRRPVFTAFCLIGVAGYAWLYGLVAPQESPLLVWAFVVICFGYGINGVLGALAPELFPTHLRSTGPGFAQNVGKGIGGMTGPPLGGVLVGKWGFATVLAAPGLLLALCGALIWLLPKVGGRELRGVETGDYLDG